MLPVTINSANWWLNEIKKDIASLPSAVKIRYTNFSKEMKDGWKNVSPETKEIALAITYIAPFVFMTMVSDSMAQFCAVSRPEDVAFYAQKTFEIFRLGFIGGGGVVLFQRMNKSE